MSFLVAVAHQVLSKASEIACSKFINISWLLKGTLVMVEGMEKKMKKRIQTWIGQRFNS